jgi:hypothetical protein
MTILTTRQKFSDFVTATSAPKVLETFALLNPEGKSYQELKQELLPHLPFSQKTLFTNLDQKWKRNVPTERVVKTVVSGAGPCGLRAACELRLLGHQVVLLELRKDCSRHNILKTSQPIIDDLIGFGLKQYMPSLKKHGFLHLGTNELQLCLLKTALLLGVQVSYQEAVAGIAEPGLLGNVKWAVWTLPEEVARVYLKKPLDTSPLSLRPGETDTTKHQQTSKVDFYETCESKTGAIATQKNEYMDKGRVLEFDNFIVAEGESSKLIRNMGFDRKIFRFAHAVGMVINLFFADEQDTRLEEFNVARMHAHWKKTALGALHELGIELENLEYMRGTKNHFFAGTTKVQELYKWGVVLEPKDTIKESLARDNLDLDRLREIGKLIAKSAGVSENAEYCDANGIQVFDFSCRGLCTESHRWLTQNNQTALVLPIGDALQNPYWPQGLGVNLGFHNALNAVWSAHLHSTVGREAAQPEITDCFESLRYSNESNHALQDAAHWTADPITRFGEFNYNLRHFDYIKRKAGKPVLDRIKAHFQLVG